MRIALVSTPFVSVPPRAYGGTERVVAELARELVALGHDVTVFATGDSTPPCALRHLFERAVWPTDDEAEAAHAQFAADEITAADPPFDVAHLHQLASARFTPRGVPTVITLHHARTDRVLAPFARASSACTLVGISRRQAALVPELTIAHVVHHGVTTNGFLAGAGRGGYCAFLGRLAPEKAPHLAIDAAVRANVPLRVAGGVHPADTSYFEREVKPRLHRAGSRAVWVGELSQTPKLEMLRGAVALLFPIQWEEPFGLVMIESMLVGTPVIAFNVGSAPEVIEDGVTGFLVGSVHAMAERLRTIHGFDRDRCRQRALQRWTATRMARDYERVYRSAMMGGVERELGLGSTAFGRLHG